MIAILLVAIIAGSRTAEIQSASKLDTLPKRLRRADVYPVGHWQPLTAHEMAKWSKPALRDLESYLGFIDTSALMVIWHGQVAFQKGDPAHKFMVHSMRKSLLSSLIGLAVADGKIRLDSTLAELEVDDQPDPLSPEEKTATVRDLLESRSGIYHPAALETPDMAALRPARHSHKPGSFWFYNNWDFNALGTIYERQTGTSIFQSFHDRIATPIGMEDFRASDGEYVTGPESTHRGYPMRMSTRDLARFGLLYLRGGRWGGHQVLPTDWVAASTRSNSDADPIGGYAYLWWVVSKTGFGPLAGAPAGTYLAWGYRGHYVAVIPSLDLVVVHRTDPDQDETEVTHREFGRLLKLIVNACPRSPSP